MCVSSMVFGIGFHNLDTGHNAMRLTGVCGMEFVDNAAFLGTSLILDAGQMVTIGGSQMYVSILFLAVFAVSFGATVMSLRTCGGRCSHG